MRLAQNQFGPLSGFDEIDIAVSKINIHDERQPKTTYQPAGR